MLSERDRDRGECLNEDTVLAYSEGELSTSDEHDVKTHLDRCADCRSLIAAMAAGATAAARDDTLSDTTLPREEGGESSTHRSVQIVDGVTTIAGKWTVLRTIGVGGMGKVVAARHIELDQIVAIKFLHKEMMSDAEAIERFKREAKTMAQLKSRHFVRIHDVGHLDGVPYLVMELLEGENLAMMVRRRGPLPWAECVAWIRQAVQALGQAHERGIVHRDIKPSNLFLATTKDGGEAQEERLCVLDFGIAKVQPIFGTKEKHLTQTRTLLGTPTFMAPEQIESSRSVDARTDIWAIGATLYQLLTARPPFKGGTVPVLCASILRESPPTVRSIRPDLPEWLDRVVARCLEKNPANRFATMKDLLAALEIPAPATAATTTTPTTSSKKRVWLASAIGLPALLVFIVTTILVINNRSPNSSPPPTTALGASSSSSGAIALEPPPPDPVNAVTPEPPLPSATTTAAPTTSQTVKRVHVTPSAPTPTASMYRRR